MENGKQKREKFSQRVPTVGKNNGRHFVFCLQNKRTSARIHALHTHVHMCVGVCECVNICECVKKSLPHNEGPFLWRVRFGSLEGGAKGVADHYLA